MSKKHYISIAKMLKARRESIEQINTLNDCIHSAQLLQLYKDIVEDIADMFAGDNSAFNRQQFYTACGLL